MSQKLLFGKTIHGVLLLALFLVLETLPVFAQGCVVMSDGTTVCEGTGEQPAQNATTLDKLNSALAEQFSLIVGVPAKDYTSKFNVNKTREKRSYWVDGKDLGKFESYVFENNDQELLKSVAVKDGRIFAAIVKGSLSREGQNFDLPIQEAFRSVLKSVNLDGDAAFNDADKAIAGGGNEGVSKKSKYSVSYSGFKMVYDMQGIMTYPGPSYDNGHVSNDETWFIYDVR